MTVLVVAVARGVLGATAVHTNVDGVVLGLHFGATNVISGDRLEGSMFISNASPFELTYSWFTGSGGRDTTIGDFVVMDENGFGMRKTVPVWHWITHGSGRLLRFGPGQTHQFAGDVVYGYSLTNPGTYFVKAIATVPTTNASLSGALWNETMVIETPSLEITVTPRSSSSPPPKPLYNMPPLADHAQIHKAIALELAAFPPLQVTHPKVEAVEPLPRKGSSRPRVLPNAQTSTANSPVKTENTNPVEAREVSSKHRPRGLYYGLTILVVLGVCGVIVWRSRRKTEER